MASRLDVLDLGGAVERLMYNAGAKETGLRAIYAAYKAIRPELMESPRYREFNRRMVRLRKQRNALSHSVEDPKTGLKEKYEPSEQVLKGLAEDGLFVLSYLEAIEASRAEPVAVTEAEVREALAPPAKQTAVTDEEFHEAYLQAKAFVERETLKLPLLAAPQDHKQPTQTNDAEGPTHQRAHRGWDRGLPPDPETAEVKERIAREHPEASEAAEKFASEVAEALAKARRKAFYMRVARNLWGVSKWLAIKSVRIAYRFATA